jgi:hypothetical protein
MRRSQSVRKRREGRREIGKGEEDIEGDMKLKSAEIPVMEEVNCYLFLRKIASIIHSTIYVLKSFYILLSFKLSIKIFIFIIYLFR